jgi:FdhD protein
VSEKSLSATRRITRWNAGVVEVAHDAVAVEEPLEIRIGDEPLAVTMRTPGHDRDLAAGFCLTEGVVAQADEIESIEPCGEAKHGNVIVVTLTESALRRRGDAITRARRELYLSSSCGLCGKQSIDRIEQCAKPIASAARIDPRVLLALPQRMREAQATFDQTGGLHAAAWFDATGKLRLLREDVGRHNAVDKVIGAALLANMLPLNPGVLLVSGRASFELVQKAAVAGAPVLAAVSAPSSLAVDLAARLNVTLVGFLRGERMNVYHDPGRIAQPST